MERYRQQCGDHQAHRAECHAALSQPAAKSQSATPVSLLPDAKYLPLGFKAVTPIGVIE